MNILIFLCIFSKSGATAAETPRKDGVGKNGVQENGTQERRGAKKALALLFPFLLFLFPYVPFLNSNIINFIFIIISIIITIIITIIGFFGFCA